MCILSVDGAGNVHQTAIVGGEGLAFLRKLSQGGTIRSTMRGKILLGLAAWLFVGASLIDCVSDLPVSPAVGSGGNGGAAGVGGNGGGVAGGGNGAAAGNGGSAEGGQIVSTIPSGGANGNVDANPYDATPVAASADANCGSQTRNPTPQAVDLLLLLDRSASMSYDIASDTNCAAGSTTCSGRWATVTTSLNQVLSATPATVQWGLKFFPSADGGKCGVDAGADVGVGPDTAAKIQPAITGTGPGATGTQTPTAAAITAAVAYFNALNDGLDHFILLATDGLPNCDPGTSAAVTSTSLGNTVTAISTAAAPGSDIKTYVIGIGSSTGNNNLTSFANAGGTVDYFPATSPDALTKALSTIVGTVASCQFTMAEAPPDRGNLGVYLDKTTKVPSDPSEGYSLAADSLTVTFNGSYCDGIKNGTYKLMDVFFGCPGVPPPDQF